MGENKNNKAAKKRKMLNRKLSLFCVLGFFAIVLLISLFLLVVPRSKVSNIEKRSLATWPEFSLSAWFSGEYTEGIKEYYDDTVPLRDSFKNIGNNIKSLSGFRTTDTVEVIGAVAKRDDATEETDEGETTAEPETETETEEETNDVNLRDELAEATMSDGIIIVYQNGHWRALGMFGGPDYTDFADAMNYLRANVSSSVEMYFMACPLACQYYLPSNYSGYAADQKTYFQAFYEELDDNIKVIDIIDTLDKHDGEDIYLRTDHHWAPLGAYYGAREFAKAAGVPFKELYSENYDTYVNEGYVGTMYALSGSATILNDPEDFVWYESKNKYVADYYTEDFEYVWTGSLFREVDVDSSYLMFMGGDEIITKVTTDVNNGRKLLVVKDSYGNAEIPFYVNSFEQIYVIDMRYCNVNLINFINANGITDFLVTIDSYSFEENMAGFLRYISQNNWEASVYDEAPDDPIGNMEQEEADN